MKSRLPRFIRGLITSEKNLSLACQPNPDSIGRRMALLFSLVFVSFACLAQEKKWTINLCLSNGQMIEHIIYRSYEESGGFINLPTSQKIQRFAFGIKVDYQNKGNYIWGLKILMVKRDYDWTTDNSFQTPPPIARHVGTYVRRQFLLEIVPGFGYKASIGKLNIDFGFIVPFIIGGKYTYDDNGTSYDAGGNIDGNGSSSFNFPGIFSWGLGSYCAPSLQIINKIKIGAEFSFAALFSKVSGVKTYTYIFNLPYAPTQNGSDKTDVSRFDFSGLETSLFISYSF